MVDVELQVVEALLVEIDVPERLDVENELESCLQRHWFLRGASAILSVLFVFSGIFC